MATAKGPASKEDVPVKVRLSLGLDKTNNAPNTGTAAPSTYGSDSNRRSISIANIAASTFFQKRYDGSWIPRYQNSYRLNPYNRFNIEIADKIAKTAMDKKLSTVTSYDPSQASKLSLEISGDILKALMKKEFDRCKLVVQVSVIQNASQSLNVGFGSLWDIERDNYSYYTFENNHIHAWCAIFGLYFE